MNFTKIPTLALIHKEFLHIFRDVRTMMILLLMPIVQILLFGFALSSEVKGARFAVLDLDKSLESAKIINALAQNPYFSLVENISSRNFSALFYGGNIDFALIVPNNFALDSRREVGRLQLILDASDANRASAINLYAQNIINAAISADSRLKSRESLQISTTMLFNPQGESAPNFVPGLLGLVLMLICAMMTSISLVREREMGSFAVLLISPLKPSGVIFAKLTPYFLLSALILAIVLLVCVFVLDLRVVGSLWLLVAFCMLYICLALAIGLLVSNLAHSQVVAMLVCAMVFMMPVMMFSGMIFPIESMPKVLQIFSHIVPTKWFILGVKKVMIEGADFALIARETMILGGALVLIFAASVKTYKARIA